MTSIGTHEPSTPADIAPQPEVRPHQQEAAPQPRQINVGWNERQFSLIGGSILTVLGLSRRSLGGLGLAAIGGAMAYRGVTGSCPAYSALGMNTADPQAPAAPHEYFSKGIHVECSITIDRSPEDLYSFWLDFQNLPRFMKHLENVQVIDDTHSRWTAKGPAGTSVQWDAEIINHEPYSLIAWRSTGQAEVDNAGSVRFIPAPADRGTEIHVVLDYMPPAGKLGSLAAKLFGEAPDQQIKEDLRRFKRLMETGEIPTIEGQPQGRCAGGR